MQVVLNERKNGKIPDSLEYVLNADKKTFNKILKILNSADEELDVSYKNEIEDPDITKEVFTVSNFLNGLSEIDKDKIDKHQKDRIHKLQKCRTEAILRKQISKDYKLSKNEVEEIFSVLDGSQSFSEFVEKKEAENKEKAKQRRFFPFLKSRENKMLPEGKDSVRNYYYDIMKNIVYGKYSFNYFMPQKQEYNDRFDLIKNRIIGEQIVVGHSIVLGEKDEPDWKINDELRGYVYKDIPQNLKSEEEAVWIYMKLCQTLHYDDRKVFENVDNKIDTDLLENVRPNSKVICFDFSRIYAKFVNSIPAKDIEAKVVGGKGHFLVALVSKNIIAKAEATSAMSSTNEFYKVKMGLPIEGMTTLSDEQKIVSDSIKRFTPLIYGEVRTIDDYMSMLNAIRIDEEKGSDKADDNELFNKLNSLAKTMKQRNISGTEAITGTMRFSSLGFLGDIEKAWIKEKTDDNGEISYRSCLAVNKKGERDNFYILDGANMTVMKLSREGLVERFKNGKYGYKNNDYTLKALKDDLPDSLHGSEESVEK